MRERWTSTIKPRQNDGSTGFGSFESSSNTINTVFFTPLKKRKKASMSLDEVFSVAENSTQWKAAYDRADIEVKLAIQIAQARSRANLTQAELARQIGTTQSVISRIERADQNLTVDTLSKIANALNSELVIQLQ